MTCLVSHIDRLASSSDMADLCAGSLMQVPEDFRMSSKHLEASRRKPSTRLTPESTAFPNSMEIWWLGPVTVLSALPGRENVTALVFDVCIPPSSAAHPTQYPLDLKGSWRLGPTSYQVQKSTQRPGSTPYWRVDQGHITSLWRVWCKDSWRCLREDHSKAIEERRRCS